VSNLDLAIVFFLQVAVLLGVCRIVGIIARRLGQPQVVAEMIAGVVLGPSLFGALLPDVHGYVFPAASKHGLYLVSQIGLVLYMFLVGLEFDTTLLSKRLRSAVAVSLAGIVVPFGLGAILAGFLASNTLFFLPEVSPWEAMLFAGASMSITAFPMLARIIYERGLAGTSLGTLALAAGSSDDAAAWCLLAVVLASYSKAPGLALLAIGGGVVYAVVMLTIGRALLRRLGDFAARAREAHGAVLTGVLMLVMLGAWITDLIGIYAVFGAFIMGVAMPRGPQATRVRQQLEPVVVNFMLPLFFVYSGLHTRLGLVDTPQLWLVSLAVLLAACLGKGVACWAAARLSGEPPRDALAIGALMNARGLMELILLNIGLERGIVTPTLFTVMVIMAICTTVMASPLFAWVHGRATAPRRSRRSARVRNLSPAPAPSP